jgi:hypothetical protein
MLTSSKHSSRKMVELPLMQLAVFYSENKGKYVVLDVCKSKEL